MNEDKFWMIFIEGRGSPAKRHPDFDEARQEATRLLRLPGNEGRRAYILGACCIGQSESPPIVWTYFPAYSKLSSISVEGGTP